MAVLNGFLIVVNTANISFNSGDPMVVIVSGLAILMCLIGFTLSILLMLRLLPE